MPERDSILVAERLRAGYGAATVIDDVCLEIRAGELVGVLGANGAGKSTLLRALVNQADHHGGMVRYQGTPTRGLPPHALARRGLALVPENRGLIPFMSVSDNLRLGRDACSSPDEAYWSEVLSLFPILRERSRVLAGRLSGGEQEMLAIARSLLMRPACLMLDEPSQGLAPKMVESIFDLLAEVSSRVGMTMIVVEQNVRVVLQLVGRAYVMDRGRIVGGGSSAELAASDHIRDAYLGGSGALGEVLS